VSNESPGHVEHEYSKILALRIFGGALGTPNTPWGRNSTIQNNSSKLVLK